MLFAKKPLELPTPETALRGRPHPIPTADNTSVDYYEVLQISPNADQVTLEKTLPLASLQPGNYQINVKVPFQSPTGLGVPLTISQGGAATTLSVRVVGSN